MHTDFFRNANGTQFDIVWTGREQSTEWNGNWGWEAQKTMPTVTNTNRNNNIPRLNIMQSQREVLCPPSSKCLKRWL